MSNNRERDWERRRAWGKEHWKRVSDQEAVIYFAEPEEATPGNIQMFRKFVGELGSPETQAAHGRQLYAGLAYVAQHREQILQKHPGEWIAANSRGIVAHADHPAKLHEQLTPMRLNPRFAVHVQFSELPYIMVPAKLIKK